MPAQNDVTDLLMYTTARIEVQTASGSTCYGTGFSYTFERGPGRYFPCLVTNKHVVKDGTRARLTLHEADPANPETKVRNSFTQLQVVPCATLFVDHPDPTIDLCAMPITPLLDYTKNQGQPIYFRGFATSMLPSQADLDKLVAVEDLLMIGYPNALWDSVNNLPLFRRGISASHPAIDYEGKSQMMVDMACFPGSSGSPVVLYRPAAATGRDPKTPLLYLLGVLFAGPVYTARGDIKVEDIPTGSVPIAVSRLMLHLGIVVKARELERIGDVINQNVEEAIQSGNKTPIMGVGQSDPW